MGYLILKYFYNLGFSKPLKKHFSLKQYLNNNYFMHTNETNLFNKSHSHLEFVRRTFSTSCLLMKKKNSREIQMNEELTELDIPEDSEYNDLMTRLGGDLNGINFIAVLQPWIKWGKRKRTETNPELLLNEACSLVKSLPLTAVAHKEIVRLQSMSKSFVFGSGSLERIRSEIRSNHAQAVFISIDHLNRVQKCNLEEQFGVPVFDRYFIVLSIFKHHASTVEAKLQIAMAELPFMNKRFFNDKDKLILDQRETKLKLAIKKIESRREKVRNNRKNSSLPSVAVVGYTNCGKTTLIKALTGDENLQGENRLFATLDVTAHKGLLPCGLNVVFLDSVGFIQDIPTSLIASFRATLQDTIYADAVVHVRDISHPDVDNQTRTVQDTLMSLPLPEDTPLIVVNNKVDLLQERTDILEGVEQDKIFTSCITGEGLQKAVERIQNQILKVTGRKKYKMRLPTGSPQIEWLKQKMGVFAEDVDEKDFQFTNIYVVLNEAEKAAFRKEFETHKKR